MPRPNLNVACESKNHCRAAVTIVVASSRGIGPVVSSGVTLVIAFGRGALLMAIELHAVARVEPFSRCAAALLKPRSGCSVFQLPLLLRLLSWNFCLQLRALVDGEGGRERERERERESERESEAPGRGRASLGRLRLGWWHLRHFGARDLRWGLRGKLSCRRLPVGA